MNKKLIVSDIDGTLAAEGSNVLNPAYYDVIRALSEKGVTVAIASGRHATSVKKLFAPVTDCIWILSQNGGVIEHQGETLVLNPIPHDWAAELWLLLAPHADLVDCVLNTAGLSYVPYDGTDMYRLLIESYRYELEVTGGWDQTPTEDISMISIYSEGDIVGFTDTYLKDKFEGRLQFLHSGGKWMDAVMPGNGKGVALERLCKELSIDPKDTIAFGDNMNDMGMIRFCGTGYAVDNACDALKAEADFVISGFKEDGVLRKLMEILASC